MKLDSEIKIGKDCKKSNEWLKNPLHISIYQMMSLLEDIQNLERGIVMKVYNEWVEEVLFPSKGLEIVIHFMWYLSSNMRLGRSVVNGHENYVNTLRFICSCERLSKHA